MFAYHFFETENRELAEVVSNYINRELTVFNHRKTKVVESSIVMNPYSWSNIKTVGEVSWEHVGQWEIQACFPYALGLEMLDKISNCIRDFLVGWRSCMSHWDAAVDAQAKSVENSLRRKELKDLWKASFDPKQCTSCRHRVDCLPLDVKRMFHEDQYHYSRDLHCVFEARINHWDHKGQPVVEVYGRGGKWHEATRFYRSLKTSVWFTFNLRILDEMRRTIICIERGYRQEVGVNFQWLDYKLKD